MIPVSYEISLGEYGSTLIAPLASWIPGDVQGVDHAADRQKRK